LPSLVKHDACESTGGEAVVWAETSRAAAANIAARCPGRRSRCMEGKTSTTANAAALKGIPR